MSENIIGNDMISYCIDGIFLKIDAMNRIRFISSGIKLAIFNDAATTFSTNDGDLITVNNRNVPNNI